MDKENTIETIQWLMRQAYFLLKEIDLQIDEYKLENEQFTLDFYDKLNEISVRK